MKEMVIMRGEQEKRCLSFVKNKMFYKIGQMEQGSVIYWTDNDVANEELKNSKIWRVDSACYQSYFGLLEQDRNEFENILRKVQENPEASSFPDFIFEDGFIEHFQITSSYEGKKGSVHTKKEREFFSIVEKETKAIENEWKENPCLNQVRSKTWAFTNPEHSYDLLSKSFRKNWEHHLASFRKYMDSIQSKKVAIFMIEYPEYALAMYENIYCDWITGMAQGDMRKPEEFYEYRLSRDKELLEYVYQFKNEIKYVIFVNKNRFEVICTENIPYLIKLLSCDYVICPLYCATHIASVYSISVPTNSKENES